VFLLQHNLMAMRRHLTINTLIISGGLSRLDALCQKLANLSGCRIQRMAEYETTARGAAWLAAGQPVGWLDQLPRQDFTPRTDPNLQFRFSLFDGVLHKLCD
jgi:glycerol kinase